MKRILGIAFVAALALSFTTTYADSKAPRASGDVTFDPVAVASGVALTFPAVNALDTGGYRALDCQFRTSNEAGGASRLFIPKCTNRTGSVTNFTYPTTTVVTNSDGQVQWDPDGALTNIMIPARTTVYPVRPCRYMKITSAAANGITQILCTLKSH
jgi:hypothetical protein